nr:Dam family site-specific DNA-(adenine-N6)-methyltransferase [Curtobacterium flaccumfaciens]
MGTTVALPASVDEEGGLEGLSGVDPLRPFIRWPGSKRLLLRQLLELVPARVATYYEPFLGGGSLLLALRPQQAVIGDVLDPLMAAWAAVKSDPDALLAQLDRWPFNRDFYMKLRAEERRNPIEKAARFLYLNRGAYGGIWRVNSRGLFNVPWADPKTPSLLDEVNLREVSAYLNKAEVQLMCVDWQEVTRNASAGDLVFLDPPYSKGRAQRPFVEYNQTSFSWDSQVELANEALRLRENGASVLVTNSSHPDVPHLYPGFRMIDVTRHSSLGSHKHSSKVITERIFSSI